MGVYEKRIAILWTTYSLKDSNGVYHFTRSFLKIAKSNNWKVDILFDKESSIKGKNSYAELKSLGARLLFPQNSINDIITNKYYSFTTGISLIELANLQSCLLESLQTNLYDLIICEPPFASMVPHLSSINIPVLWYTHSPGSITGDYDDGHTNKDLYKYIDKISNNCIVGTQTDYNRDILSSRGVNAITLPLPFPDIEIFTPTSIEKSGILFCGSTEKRKQFDKFFDLIVATKLPAKIMTSPKSGEKMKKQFADVGITDVEIKCHILGDEKRDFIAGSKIFFTPSFSESFGYAFAESIPHTHVVAFNYNWTKNFNNKYCHIIPQTGYIDYIETLYHNAGPIHHGAMDYIKRMHDDSKIAWSDFINKPKLIHEKHNKNFIDIHRSFWLKDLCKLINRPNLSLDEINPLVKRCMYNNVKIQYTDNDTWVSLDGNDCVVSDSPIFNTLFG